MFSVFSNKKPTEYIKTLQDCAGSEFTRLLLAGPPEEPLYMLKPEVIPFLKWINRKILFELPYIKTARDVKYIDIRIRIATNMFLNTYEQKGILSKDICITYHNRLTERVRKIIGYIYTEDLPFLGRKPNWDWYSHCPQTADVCHISFVEVNNHLTFSDCIICLIMKNPRITPEEVGIIKKAQAGDESAFNALFYKYKGFVENLLFKYIKDMDEAKDIANIVFLKVHDKLSSFTAYDSFGGWLRIVTNRTAIDYLRETKNKCNVLGEADARLSSDTLGCSLEDDLVNRLTYERLLTEFDKFPETTRKVFKLFYVNNMTVEEISKSLRIPTGTIKSTLSRTRRKIKQKLNLKT